MTSPRPAGEDNEEEMLLQPKKKIMNTMTIESGVKRGLMIKMMIESGVKRGMLEK